MFDWVLNTEALKVNDKDTRTTSHISFLHFIADKGFVFFKIFFREEGTSQLLILLENHSRLDC